MPADPKWIGHELRMIQAELPPRNEPLSEPAEEVGGLRSLAGWVGGFARIGAPWNKLAASSRKGRPDDRHSTTRSG